MRRALGLPVLLLAATAAGCVGPWYDYGYAPVPQEVRLTDERVPGAQARALVALVGIRRPEDGAPARVEVRLRLQNLGSVPLELRRDGLELVSADLTSFGPGELALREGLELKPAETIVHAIDFDLPPGKRPWDYDLDGVAFSWEVDFGAGPVSTSVSFQRLPRYVVDPYWHGYYGPYGWPGPYCDPWYWW
jgi:hypothetical protein